MRKPTSEFAQDTFSPACAGTCKIEVLELKNPKSQANFTTWLKGVTSDGASKLECQKKYCKARDVSGSCWNGSLRSLT